MGAGYYFDFLGTVWEYLTSEDRGRYSELWRGYEQVLADYLQKINESDLNITVQDQRPWEAYRWLPHTFNSDTFLNVNATYTSSQDISLGISTLNRYLLNLSFDDKPPMEINITGVDAVNTTIDEIITKINDRFGFRFSKAVLQGSTIQLVSPTAGVTSKVKIWPTSVPSANASEFLLGVLVGTEVVVYPEYPYIYSLTYNSVASIPILFDKIREESRKVTLVEGADYQITKKSIISFKVEPPELMRAPITNIDSENPWYNFGYLMDIYQPNSESYIRTLQGLWFAFWTGPRPANLQIALYLLFGLPVADEAGIITSVTVDTIVLQGSSRKQYTYPIPSGLFSKVVVGDEVKKFAPLVTGIEIYDKINRPGFIEDEIGRQGIQRFLTEDATTGSSPDTDESKALKMLEEHTFLPQISVESFVNPDIDLGNVRIFLDAIKPSSKAYLFQVIVGEFQDELVFDEFANMHEDFDVTQNVDWNITGLIGEDTLLDHETVVNEGLNVDADGVQFTEGLEVEVYDHGILIDSFTA